MTRKRLSSYGYNNKSFVRNYSRNYWQTINETKDTAIDRLDQSLALMSQTMTYCWPLIKTI